MIKVVAPAQRHPTNRATLAEFQRYWAESHGPLYANTKRLRRYVQHLTLPEAYGIDPAPTYDGVSMFWFDDYDPFNLANETDETVRALQEEVGKDDRQLFDRLDTWPRHNKSASVIAEERVIVEGETTPEMVKAIFVATKLPGLKLSEFFERWQHHHGPLAAQVPGVRRYVQNHAVPAAYAGGRQSHDGWSELWFDDLAALHGAVASAAWQVLREDGATLFARPIGVGVARERIQKDLDWTYHDWGVGALDEAAVHQRLVEGGFSELAADPGAPSKIKAAAEGRTLAVWSAEHLVTIDESRIDARPQR
jgi:uncharacterized protein (TIGR02118 family)